MLGRFVRLALVAVLLLTASCGSVGQSRTPGSSASTPAPAIGSSSSPSVVTSPTPMTPAPTAAPGVAPPACPSGFGIADVSGGSSAGGSVVTARVGGHSGYDRFVVEFAGGVPTYSVRMQPGTTFMQSPKGEQVTLEGTSGILVTFQPALEWTSYAGPLEMRPGYPELREARLLENFEAVQQWGLGVTAPACMRVFTLGSPPRLVVDVAAAG